MNRPPRYNARGERWCPGCQAYLARDQFAPRNNRPDPYTTRCRACTNALARRGYRRRVLRMSEAEWRRRVEADMERQRRTRANRAAERQGFVADAIALVRSKGFTYDELQELIGMSRMTMRRYERDEPRNHVQRGTVERLQSLLTATADLPQRPVGRNRNRPPHPDLGLVRARLDRMAWLQELEAA